MPTHLDLFSGIGGFALAAQWAGFTTVGFCEIDPYAQRVLQKNFGAVVADADKPRCETQRVRKVGQGREAMLSSAYVASDIITLSGTDYLGVDLITGGFPCQPYSVAGKRRGAEDDRALWPEMLRVIAEARPAWVVGENVAGIIDMELDRVLSDLETLGYATRPFVIPACAVDAKHRRDRVWIVANTTERRREWRGTASRQTGKSSDLSQGPSKNVGDSSNGGIRCREAQRESGQPTFAGQDVADAISGGQSGSWKPINAEHSAEASTGEAVESRNGSGPSLWLPEPELGRVAHGIPNRVHRLRSLGNSIVPQVAYPILKAIHEDLTHA